MGEVDNLLDGIRKEIQRRDEQISDLKQEIRQLTSNLDLEKDKIMKLKSRNQELDKLLKTIEKIQRDYGEFKTNGSDRE